MRSIFRSKSTSKWVIKNEISMIFDWLWEVFLSWCYFSSFQTAWALSGSRKNGALAAHAGICAGGAG